MLIKIFKKVFSSSENGFFTNLNRVFPGEDPNNSTVAASNPQGYAYRIWNDLWGNTTNVDIAVDLRNSPSPRPFLRRLPTRFLVLLLFLSSSSPRKKTNSPCPNYITQIR